MASIKDGKTGNGLSNTPAAVEAKSLKRKQPPDKEDEKRNGNARQRKRAKILDARAIATQSSDKALKSGRLDVNAFVQAREFEIRALEEGMASAKYVSRGLLGVRILICRLVIDRKSSTRRAFQLVPRDMRRRTASHNVKVVPKRLRVRAEKEVRISIFQLRDRRVAPSC
jgi:ribonuclease P/MRP protein subunit POP1